MATDLSTIATTSHAPRIQIITVECRQIGNELTQTVSARELHAFLGVGKVFAAWIQERITQYGFVAGSDFEVFSDSGNNLSVGRPIKEYAITLDMAKELAMVERNESGKQARRYFIECERRAKTSPVSDRTKLTGELALLECFARLLRPAPSCQLSMLAAVAEQNGLNPAFLPRTAVDAPPSAANGSSFPTAPLTTLLKSNGVSTTPAQYNDMLRATGMLEQRTRRSTAKGSKNGEKHFWCITERGLAYGKNLTSPSSPRETQPHWYVGRFPELHRLVSARLLGAT
jgi:phage anti-repressor protein